VDVLFTLLSLAAPPWTGATSADVGCFRKLLKAYF